MNNAERDELLTRLDDRVSALEEAHQADDAEQADDAGAGDQLGRRVGRIERQLGISADAAPYADEPGDELVRPLAQRQPPTTAPGTGDDAGDAGTDAGDAGNDGGNAQ